MLNNLAKEKCQFTQYNVTSVKRKNKHDYANHNLKLEYNVIVIHTSTISTSEVYCVNVKTLEEID